MKINYIFCKSLHEPKMAVSLTRKTFWLQGIEAMESGLVTLRDTNNVRHNIRSISIYTPTAIHLSKSIVLEFLLNFSGWKIVTTYSDNDM